MVLVLVRTDYAQTLRKVSWLRARAEFILLTTVWLIKTSIDPDAAGSCRVVLQDIASHDTLINTSGST